MKNKLIAMTAGILVCALASVRCGAYTLYARGKSAAVLDERYSEELSEINSRFEAALEQPEPAESEPSSSTESEDSESEQPGNAVLLELYAERIAIARAYRAELGKSGRKLAEKLIDYDVSLKKLRVQISRYESRKKKAAVLERLFRTGECDEKAFFAARDEADGIYLEIRSLLFDISAAKSGIENITGEPLKDSFDFDSVYLIADVLAENASDLGDRSRLCALYQPVGSDFGEYEAPEVSAEFTSAVQAYRKLGEALREYLNTAANVKKGEKDHRLGRISGEELTELTEAKEDAFLAAAQAKADLSKALFALDESAGWGLTFGYGISGEEVGTLRGTLTEARRGTGLWFAVRGEEGVMLCTAALPSGVCRPDEDDTAAYGYTVRYGKKVIGSATTGAPCVLSEIPYEDGENYAEITFFRNSVKTGVYRLDIFAPYGGFIG